MNYGFTMMAAAARQSPPEPLEPPQALSASSGDADALTPPEIIE